MNRDDDELMFLCLMNKYGGSFFLICTEEQGSIGFVKLQKLSGGRYEIVFAVGRQDLRGARLRLAGCGGGVAGDVFRLPRRSITPKIKRENTRSIGAVTRCGFTRSGGSERYLHYTITMDQYTDRLRRGSAGGVRNAVYSAGMPGNSGRKTVLRRDGRLPSLL